LIGSNAACRLTTARSRSHAVDAKRVKANPSIFEAKTGPTASAPVPAVQQHDGRSRERTVCFLVEAVDPVLPDALVYVASYGETASQLVR
jgi:hypothetical protein